MFNSQTSETRSTRQQHHVVIEEILLSFAIPERYKSYMFELEPRTLPNEHIHTCINESVWQCSPTTNALASQRLACKFTRFMISKNTDQHAHGCTSEEAKTKFIKIQLWTYKHRLFDVTYCLRFILGKVLSPREDSLLVCYDAMFMML